MTLEWSAQAMDSLQAGRVVDDAPPIVGVGAQLTLFAFLIVMLIVPWILARESAARGDRVSEGGPVDVASRSLFSSDRERHLWLWTLAVLVAVYSTLSPAQELAAILRERNLLGVTSGAVLLVVAALIAAQWARTRPGRREIGAGVGVMAVYLTTLIRLPVPEARSHLFEYGVAAMLIYHALLERRRNGRRVPAPWLLALAATTLLGWLDEGIQAFLPNRVYDILDVGFNALAGLMAILASLFMAWARRWDFLAGRSTQ